MNYPVFNDNGSMQILHFLLASLSISRLDNGYLPNWQFRAFLKEAAQIPLEVCVGNLTSKPCLLTRRPRSSLLRDSSQNPLGL